MRPLLAVVFLLFLSACSPIGPECAKAEECDELGDQTQEQCAADWSAKQEATEADEECEIVVEKTLALFACKSDLSCEEREDVGSSTCASLNSDLLGAVVSKPQCLFK